VDPVLPENPLYVDIATRVSSGGIEKQPVNNRDLREKEKEFPSGRHRQMAGSSRSPDLPGSF
jgi:hypothetical protein